MAKETAPAYTVSLPPAVTQSIMRAADFCSACVPQSYPQPEQIASTTLVGHRGCKDVSGIKENTLAAFDYALENGCTGLEFDIRWTADKQFVVAHDADLQRVFGIADAVDQLTAKQLRQKCPAIPSVEEVINRYHGKAKFYIEIKSDGWSNPSQQQHTLAALLSPLQAQQDYLLLSFDIELLAAMTGFPPESKTAIMHSNRKAILDYLTRGAVKHVGGHYILLNQAFRNLCKHQNIGLGVGFPSSANSLYREIKRGADFILLDNPAKLQHWLNK